MNQGGNTIEKLLQDRSQYVAWLTRLNATGEASSPVPEAVRGRIRTDYERRLEAVLEELRGHTAAIEEQVDVLAARAEELRVREAQHREQLAEAEVRHLVGEYDDGKWDAIRGELLKTLTHVRGQFESTSAEVDRLNEVLLTIHAPVVPVEPTGPMPSLPVTAPRPAVTPPPVPELLNPAATLTPENFRQAQPPAVPTPPAFTEIPFRPPVAKPAPKPAVPPPAPAARKEEPQPGRTLWFPSGKPETGPKQDELAFLKSIGGSETTAAPPPPATPAGTTAPRRASGGFGRPGEAAPAPAPASPPPPAAPAPRVTPAPVAAPPSVPDPPKDRPSAGQKTLKCGECGTLNRPTEWYCERCGAELAAL